MIAKGEFKRISEELAVTYFICYPRIFLHGLTKENEIPVSIVSLWAEIRNWNLRSTKQVCNHSIITFGEDKKEEEEEN
jgi:hypothetical protein